MLIMEKKSKRNIPLLHELKTSPEFYWKIINGTKPFEIRKNDRDYRIGDILVLREFNQSNEQYTGRFTTVKVTYMTDFSQKDGYVVLGIKSI